MSKETCLWGPLDPSPSLRYTLYVTGKFNKKEKQTISGLNQQSCVRFVFHWGLLFWVVSFLPFFVCFVFFVPLFPASPLCVFNNPRPDSGITSTVQIVTPCACVKERMITICFISVCQTYRELKPMSKVPGWAHTLVCVCNCKRERRGGRGCVYVWEREREKEGLCVHVCVCLNLEWWGFVC